MMLAWEIKQMKRREVRMQKRADRRRCIAEYANGGSFVYDANKHLLDAVSGIYSDDPGR